MLWLGGIALCAVSFFRPKSFDRSISNRRDAICILVLLAMALPIFLWSVYDVPFQFNNDESVHMLFEQRWAREGRTDLFGISPYFGFPYFPFLFLGWAGNLLGGIDLSHQRFLHGLNAVSIVVASYCFFRVLGLKKLVALTASMVVCTNHVLILYSRRAMWDPVLPEILTLMFLFAGLRFRSLLLSYCGGLFAGFCFYQYSPARISIPLSLLFLFILFCSNSKSFARKDVLKATTLFMLGLTLAASPILVAHLRDPETSKSSIAYQRSICILFPEGRRTTRLFNDSKNETEGVIRNIVYGLTAFNNMLNDRGHWAKNEASNNCFLDPLSGLLFWLGFFSLLPYFRGRPAVMLMVSGVMLQLLFFGFIVGQAPDFFRLLVTLPFVGYFVANGIVTASSFADSRFKGSPRWANARHACFIGLSAAVVLWNGFIVWTYCEDGFTLGDEAGGTVRYIDARKGQKEHCFIFADAPNHHYFSWAKKSDWRSWIEPFLGQGQSVRFFTPEDLTRYRLIPPFTIFMDGELWQEKCQELKKMYPQIQVQRIAQERGLLALEDKRSTVKSRSLVDYLPLIERELREGRNLNVIALSEKALASMSTSNFGSDYKAAILLAQGIAYMNTKKCKLAVETLGEALKIQEEASGLRDCELSQYAYKLGDAFMCLHQFGTAERYYREGLQMALNAKDDEYFEMEPPEIAQGNECIAKAILGARTSVQPTVK